MDATKWLATQAGWSALFNTPRPAKKQSIGEKVTPTKKGLKHSKVVSHTGSGGWV